MVIMKARSLPLLFLCSLFLASVSFTLGNHHEHEIAQCLEQCPKQDMSQYVACHSRCMEHQQGARGHHMERDDPRQEFEQCQQRCQSQERGDQQQQQRCQEQCPRPMSQRQSEEMCQQRCEKEEKEPRQQQQCQTRCQQQSRGQDNPTDPEKKFEQCQKRCQSQQRSSPQECQQECVSRMSQQDRQQMCQQHCKRQERDPRQQRQCQSSCEEKLEDPLQDNRHRDPEQKYQQCQQSCQESEQHGQGKQQQESCQQRCAARMSQGERKQMCQQRCQRQGSSEPQQQQQCQRSCEEKLEEQAREHQGRGLEINPRDTQEEQYEEQHRQYQQCQQICQRHGRGQQQQQCQRMCKKQFEEQQREQEQGQGEGQCQKRCQSEVQGQREQKECQRRCQQQRGQNYSLLRREDEEEQSQSQSQRDNPFYFPSQRFESKLKSEEGGMYVLERFTSKLLRGIKNYRLAIFEASPNTFVLPHHCDAESIYYVLNGRGGVTILIQDNKDSSNIEQGDVIRVPAGATVYLINHNNDETLRIAKLIQSVNHPSGRFEEFFPAGYDNPESYYSVFSNEILESAFDTPREQLERVFGQEQRRQGFGQGQRRQGMVMKASPEQLRALSKHDSSPWRKIRGGSKAVFNLPSQRPLHSNNYGKTYEARPEEFNQLQDMDVSVIYTEMNQGSIMLPHFNSKATYLMMVEEGSGRFEIASPQLMNQEQEMEGEQYEGSEQSGQSQQNMKFSAEISRNDVFVVPAGHPVAIVAQNNNNNNDHQNQNLRLVGFGINARNNRRNFLAGQEANPIMEMQREARQLAFGEEMEKILNKQKQSYFAQHRQGRSPRLASILEFAGII